MKVKIHKGFWTRDQVAKDVDSIYVFGDNCYDYATDYYPGKTQAVIRGLDNSLGLVTKKDRGTSPSSYFENKNLNWFKLVVEEFIEILKVYQKDGKTICFPEDGIGTGKAMLREKAPACWKYLCERLKEEFDYDNGQST